MRRVMYVAVRMGGFPIYFYILYILLHHLTFCLHSIFTIVTSHILSSLCTKPVTFFHHYALYYYISSVCIASFSETEEGPWTETSFCILLKLLSSSLRSTHRYYSIYGLPIYRICYMHFVILIILLQYCTR